MIYLRNIKLWRKPNRRHLEFKNNIKKEGVVLWKNIIYLLT